MRANPGKVFWHVKTFLIGALILALGLGFFEVAAWIFSLFADYILAAFCALAFGCLAYIAGLGWHGIRGQL